jgi:hypothetical protein
MNTPLRIVVAAALVAFLASPALAKMQSNQAETSRAPVATNSTFNGGYVGLGVDRDPITRLGPDGVAPRD